MGTHYKGSKEEVRALNAFIALARASGTLEARLSPLVAERGLSESQFDILEALWHLGPLCQAELGRKILCSGGNITFVVDNLEKAGLVKRERSTEDRRFITVRLTDKGRRLVGGMLPRHVRAIVEHLGALTAPEQEELRRLCRKLGKGGCCDE